MLLSLPPVAAPQSSGLHHFHTNCELDMSCGCRHPSTVLVLKVFINDEAVEFDDDDDQQDPTEANVSTRRDHCSTPSCFLLLLVCVILQSCDLVSWAGGEGGLV